MACVEIIEVVLRDFFLLFAVIELWFHEKKLKSNCANDFNEVSKLIYLSVSKVTSR